MSKIYYFPLKFKITYNKNTDHHYSLFDFQTMSKLTFKIFLFLDLYVLLSFVRPCIRIVSSIYTQFLNNLYFFNLISIFCLSLAAFIQFLLINDSFCIPFKIGEIKQIFGTINLKFKTKINMCAREITTFLISPF